MNGKGAGSKKPKLAGIDEIDLPTAETDVPHAYFAGVAKLNVAWLMQPVIAFTHNTPGGAGKK